ncbi:MAG: hypothetical protein IPO83_00205 [Chitinophagaceae bacterium]|nr:hypothetical protein [Chitinophagaceae bacterium]
MKKSLLVLTLLISFVTISMAQQNEFEYIKSQYKNDRKTLLMNYLKLSEADAAKFWPIYREYESERAQLADRRFNNIKSYAEQYATITNEQAETFISNFFEAGAKESAIEKKYAGQFKKAVGAKTTLQWLQFEAYLDAALQYELLHNIPFVSGK